MLVYMKNQVPQLTMLLIAKLRAKLDIMLRTLRHLKSRRNRNAPAGASKTRAKGFSAVVRNSCEEKLTMSDKRTFHHKHARSVAQESREMVFERTQNTSVAIKSREGVGVSEEDRNNPRNLPVMDNSAERELSALGLPFQTNGSSQESEGQRV